MQNESRLRVRIVAADVIKAVLSASQAITTTHSISGLWSFLHHGMSFCQSPRLTAFQPTQYSEPNQTLSSKHTESESGSELTSLEHILGDLV